MEEGGGPHDSGRRPQRARIVPARLRQSCENGTRAGRHEQAKSKADRVSGVAQGSGRPLELRRGQVSRQVPGSHSIDDPQNASDPVEEQRANASVGEERSQQERISAVAPSAFRPNPQSNAYRVGGVERQQPLEVAPTIQDAPPASLSNAQPAAGRQPTDGITPSALQFNRTKERLQASADNAIGKPYDQWALSLLQKVCTIRKIPRMSACRNRGFLVRLLQGQDLREQRKSPHIADLYDIAADVCMAEAIRANPAPTTVTPENNVSVAPTSLKGRKRGPGAAAWCPSSKRKFPMMESFVGSGAHAAVTSTTGTPNLAGDGGAVMGSGSRKTRHDMYRLVSIMVQDDVRPLLFRGHGQGTYWVLNAGASGWKQEAWEVLVSRYVDPNYKVSPIVTHPTLVDCDCNYISQPTISVEKLCAMWRSVRAKWEARHETWKSLPGEEQPWDEFCQGEKDVLILGEAIKLYPELAGGSTPEFSTRKNAGSSVGIVAGGEVKRVDASTAVLPHDLEVTIPAAVKSALAEANALLPPGDPSWRARERETARGLAKEEFNRYRRRLDKRWWKRLKKETKRLKRDKKESDEICPRRKKIIKFLEKEISVLRTETFSLDVYR